LKSFPASFEACVALSTGREGRVGVVFVSGAAAVSNSGCSEGFTGLGRALLFSSNLMGSEGFQVLSFGLPTLAYVRDHCEVEAMGVMRGVASAGRMRSARKAARGSIVLEVGDKIQIKKESAFTTHGPSTRRL
jgi:hypothetical protein